jgi:glutamine cyclotransferase
MDPIQDTKALFVISSISLLILIGFSGCFGEERPPDVEPVAGPAVEFSYDIVNTYPHDPGAFTQGLVYHNGHLYEGTGRYGESDLRWVDLETGEVLKQVNLSEEDFGEGITILDKKIYQLTWKEKKGFVYDLDTFELLETFNYSSEGWGLTHDGTDLIMSDGSSTLYFRDPGTFEVARTLEVTEAGSPVDRLNELEYIEGEIYANIWQTDRIAVISPDTGYVTKWLNLTGLLRGDEVTGGEDVLNGIAYDEGGDRLFVTGKWWPYLYEIEIVENK